MLQRYLEPRVLAAVNGLDQGAGAEFRAREVSFSPGRDVVRFSLDIAPAWPSEGKVARWRRFRSRSAWSG